MNKRTQIKYPIISKEKNDNKAALVETFKHVYVEYKNPQSITHKNKILRGDCSGNKYSTKSVCCVIGFLLYISYESMGRSCGKKHIDFIHDKMKNLTNSIINDKT
ncbi:MAG: hypothetical protein JRG74_13655 [Deltaproteobacteria bacterium]|nr:hypothetical protein [Deltaproteobacteria bacterium]